MSNVPAGSLDGSRTVYVYHPFPPGFCADVFWVGEVVSGLLGNRSVTWDTTTPRLTRCFQQTALVWIPCAFFWLTIPLQAYYVKAGGHRMRPWTWVSAIKLVLCTVLVALSLTDVFYVADTWRREGVDALPDVDLIAPLLKTLTLILVAGCIYVDERRARSSSGIMFIFWLLMSVKSVVVIWSKLASVETNSVSDRFWFITHLTSFLIVVIQFMLTWIAECVPVLVESSQKPSPELSASLPSWMTWSWFSPLVYRGWKQPLLQNDLWDLIKEDRTNTNVDRLDKFWDQEIQKTKRRQLDASAADFVDRRYSASLTKALVKAFIVPSMSAGFCRLLSDLLTFVSPQILRLLIQFIDDPTVESWKGYFYAFILLIAGTAQSFFLNHYKSRTMRVGLQMRGALMAAVYRKALKITSAAKRSRNTGEIVNLMTVDAQRLNDLMNHIHGIWCAPLALGLTVYFLWEILGVAVFAGLGILIVTIPANLLLARVSKRIEARMMNEKDARIKLTTEVLNGMKVLKLYAWEESFEKQVLEVRERELKQLRKVALMGAVFAFNWSMTPFLIGFLSFMTYVLLSPDNILNADTAFVALSLLNLLSVPLTFLQHCVTVLVKSHVSLDRLTKFLTNDEHDPDNVRFLPAKEVGAAVQISDGYFAWGKDDSVCLRGINLEVASQELVAVVGQVGSGKSSLVAAMLGLIEKVSGGVSVRGTVAYVPQQAWIQNLTLKENILFGNPLNEDRYQRVLDACALRPDLFLLPAGDQTEIGEKGVNLSGGQRQRVSLARAVYCDADVYFLDDPLSAVDAHVGKHICEHVVGPYGMLKDKTRILVTHGIGYLPQVDRIVVLGDQQISETGTYEELLRNNGAFADFLRTYYLNDLADLEQGGPKGAGMKEDILTEMGRPKSLLRSYSSSSSNKSPKADRKTREGFRRQQSKSSTEKFEDGGIFEKNPESFELLEMERDDENGKLMVEETAEMGRVKFGVFQTYFKNATYRACLGMLGCQMAVNALGIGGSFWLATWVDDADIPERRKDSSWRDYRLAIYGVFGIVRAFFVLSSSLIEAYGRIMASRNLHRSTLKRVMRAPMSFFDTTPLGRIINRFSRDMEIVDTVIPWSFDQVITCALAVTATFAAISISIPIFAFVIAPLCILYFVVQRLFVPTNRQLKRLEAVSASPIYSHFQESVQGSSVILATRQSGRFVAENEHLVDDNNMPSYLNMVSQRWVGIRLDCMGNLVTFFAALFAVLSRDMEGLSVSAEEVGLSVSYALSATQLMNWMVRFLGEMESNVVSVERISEYSHVANEAPWIVDGQRPEKGWPKSGEVDFSDYQARYRPDLDLVLRGVDCHIEAGEKIGIVGRTGAGKSSLTLALFRIIESAGGSIVIDGVEIAKLGLHDVRSRITILPQEPVLFSGPLRMNLDPFQAHNDDEIWSALEHSHLRNFVGALPNGLSHLIAEGGENLSVGQRQLICLARALLRKTKILVLDEATAAIDLETDALIQETIRDEFADCTILTIAHRLKTVMDSTRVMVLDGGMVREFASPADLLADPSSIFYSLAKSAKLVA